MHDTEPAPAEAADTRTVLIVDDDATIRWLLCDVLEGLGCLAEQAAGEQEAMAVLRSGIAIDLLVTDFDLPGGGNGRQLAEAARALRPGLPVLFVTGHDRETLAAPGADEGNTALLSKPFTAAALERAAERLLGRR